METTIFMFASEGEQSVSRNDHLTKLEAVIERGLETFIDVGMALLAIKDMKLYKQEKFSDYCRERWGFERNYANRLIAAAAVVNSLVPIGTILPATESQARPLTNLEPDLQREVWAQVVDNAPNGKITAAHVQSVVNQHIETPGKVRDGMKVHYSSETPEHYTPVIIINAVLDCLGSIDVDPCSNSHDDPNVPADTHYTIDDNGLGRAWVGKIYMNPPYGREINAWVEKLCGEHDAGNVTEAIALVPARTDTQWFKRLRDYPVCFIEGRLSFVGNEDPAPFPSALFYLGENIEAFYWAFSSLGDIWQRIEPGMYGE